MYYFTSIGSRGRRVKEKLSVLSNIQELVREPRLVTFKIVFSNPVYYNSGGRGGGWCLTIINILRALFRLTEETLSCIIYLLTVNSQLCPGFKISFKISDWILKRFFWNQALYVITYSYCSVPIHLITQIKHVGIIPVFSFFILFLPFSSKSC